MRYAIKVSLPCAGFSAHRCSTAQTFACVTCDARLVSGTTPLGYVSNFKKLVVILFCVVATVRINYIIIILEQSGLVSLFIFVVTKARRFSYERLVRRPPINLPAVRRRCGKSIKNNNTKNAANKRVRIRSKQTGMERIGQARLEKLFHLATLIASPAASAGVEYQKPTLCNAYLARF